VKHPIIVLALRLADECGRLRVRNSRLTCDLAKAHERVRTLADELAQTRRDADLLALMARDRTAALEFVRTRHDITHLDEITEVGGL
jgi:hypothetical protein